VGLILPDVKMNIVIAFDGRGKAKKDVFIFIALKRKVIARMVFLRRKGAVIFIGTEYLLGALNKEPDILTVSVKLRVSIMKVCVNDH
jgi:hypothetical protein